MAQQIKKKFIGPDQIDGSKIKLLEGQSIRGTNSLGEEVDLVKIGSLDNVEVLGQEVALKSELDQENVRAVAEELRLAGLISAEEAARIADVADLQSKIDFITENTDPEALDSLKEIVEAFQSADGDLQTSITNLSTTAANDRAAIRQEFADADAALQAQIDALDTNFVTEEELATAVSGIQSQIDGLDSRLDDIEPKVSTLESEMDAVQDELISLDSRLDTLEAFGYDQIVYVSKNGLDTNTGKQHSPFLTITAAQDSILDASPSKRYIIKVAPGSYTETSLALKANVFIVGEGQKEAVRITGALSLGPSFTANSSFDHRSGASNVTFLSAANFDWNAVQSAAGKLYFNETVFGSTLSMNGYNNAIAQAQFNSCVIFGAFTVSGINVGVFTNNVCYGNVTLNQHPNGGMVTTLSATGGYCSGTVRLTSTVNDFNKRCSVFLRGFWSENLISDGPVSYADVDLTSGSKQGAQTLNGGQVIPLNPVLSHDLRTQMIQPRSNNAHNSGDWGNQWFFNFAYVYASSGTDMYISTVGSSYDPAGDDAGRTVFIDADGYGLKPDVNGGNVQISTATTSGTGVRGKVILNGREVDVTSKQIKNLADGTLATDAVNKGQLDAAIGAIPQITFNKESKTVDATIISNEYIDLAFEAKANSIVMFVGRLAMIEGSDYSVSDVGGVSRITFLSPMLVPSPEALELGDIIHVTYAK